MKTQLNATTTRILGSPVPGDAPWTELPFPTYWVDHFPSSSSALPQFMAVVHDEDQRALWLEAVDDLDDALSKALAAAQSEDTGRAVVYRYLVARGAADVNSASKYSILIDGYYDLSTTGIATWVSALEVADASPLTS